MIIQCDQCNTKFKLDDAKVPDKGVKVRCAKCKHIFKVQRDVPPEETDFDFLLSGLGAPASDAETGVSQPGEAALPSTAGEEGGMFAEGADATREEPGETPVAGDAEQAGREDFGEDFFAVKEEPAPPEEKGFEPGEFPFAGDETQLTGGAAATPESRKGETTGFEFGEFPFTGEEGATHFDLPETPPAGSVETEGFDFAPGDFGTDDSAAMKAGEGREGIAAGQPTEEGFPFGEEQAPPEAEKQEAEWQPEQPAEGEGAFDIAPAAVPLLPEKEAETATFIAEAETGEAGTVHIESGEIGGGAAGPAMAKTEEIRPTPEERAVPPEPVAEKPSVPSFAASTPSGEEELPPLAISTRRKGSSIFAIVVTAIAVLVVLAIAGFGLYFFKEGPSAFDKLKLSFLARWVGMEAAEEGGIVIKNPQGAFMVNRVAGDIFVVSGEAVNNFKKPRASIQVKAIVLGPKGETLMQKTAYCGNLLSKEQLTTLPMAKIEDAMGSPFGDSLANLGVQPGKEIPFVVVFSGVPKNAAEFSVEVAGSTVAGQ